MENEYFSLPMDVETLGKQGLHERDTECCSSRGGTFRRGFHAEGVDGELFGPYEKESQILCEMFGCRWLILITWSKWYGKTAHVYAQGLDKYLKEMEAKGRPFTRTRRTRMAISENGRGTFNLVMLNNESYEKETKFTRAIGDSFMHGVLWW